MLLPFQKTVANLGVFFLQKSWSDKKSSKAESTQIRKKNQKNSLDSYFCFTNFDEKIQKNKHTREDAKKAQDLNRFRSELCNAINRELKERENIRI